MSCDHALSHWSNTAIMSSYDDGGCVMVLVMLRKELYSRKENMPIIKNCICCFKIIKLSPSKVKRGMGTYCSVNCMTKDYASRFKGEFNPNYKHGLSKSPDFYKESGKIKRKEWKKNNKKKVKMMNAINRGKRNGSIGEYTIKDIENKLIEQNNCCYWCLEELLSSYQIDHIIPIAKNGSNYVDNIVISCSWCNRQKSDKLVSEWYQQAECRAIRENYAPGSYSK